MKYASFKMNYWLAMFLFTDFIFTFIVWIIRPDVFKNVSLLIGLFTVIILSVCFYIKHHNKRKIFEKIDTFLELPTNQNKDNLIGAIGEDWRKEIEHLFLMLSVKTDNLNKKTMELEEYREYIEAWAHEIKTPLSLLTLVNNNRKDEMTPYVYGRMNYVEQQISENVERILYYARLQVTHNDYKYEEIELDRCVRNVVERYQAFESENKTFINLDVERSIVVSDQRVLNFMLSQLIGNAVKYADKSAPQISISSRCENDKVILTIRNNGNGIPPEDAPFIFDKGFTGSHPDRQKATGIGLYLVKKYAEKLCIKIKLEPISTTGQGFGIELIFTI